MRSGLVLEKIGMTRLFTDAGEHVPVTVLRLPVNQVISHKVEDKHGYTSLVLAYGDVKPQRLSNQMLGVYKKGGFEPKRKVAEFRVTPENLPEVGTSLTVEHFEVGQFIDVQGVTIGKGFAGVMKRHNFGGLRASHGVSVSHRSHGSTGQRQDPGKVFKGKKMAGHMGCDKVTIQNLKVVQVDPAQNLLFVKGAVPGADHTFVRVRDAVKKQGKK
jgi:large subunit ribosomal protein L3